MRLTHFGDDLVLEMYNYRGPKKVFWELRWPGGFFQGVPQSGFYVEMAERVGLSKCRRVWRVVAGGKLTDTTAAPFTYSGTGERVWTVAYSRDGKSLGIEADLMKWKLKRRWNEQGEIGWPMLESAIARETRTGQIKVGDAQASMRQRSRLAIRLARDETLGRWLRRTDSRTLTLTVPGGKVEDRRDDSSAPSFGTTAK